MNDSIRESQAGAAQVTPEESRAIANRLVSPGTPLGAIMEQCDAVLEVRTLPYLPYPNPMATLV